MTLSLFGGSGRHSNVFDPFSLDIWDPFQGFNSIINFFPPTAGDTSAFAQTRIDWKETPETHVFNADLPGLKKEEVKVELEEGDVLQFSGERSREQVELWCVRFCGGSCSGLSALLCIFRRAWPNLRKPTIWRYRLVCFKIGI